MKLIEYIARAQCLNVYLLNVIIHILFGGPSPFDLFDVFHNVTSVKTAKSVCSSVSRAIKRKYEAKENATTYCEVNHCGAVLNSAFTRRSFIM